MIALLSPARAWYEALTQCFENIQVIHAEIVGLWLHRLQAKLIGQGQVGRILPPRHAPKARAQTRGRKVRQRSGELASSQTTGMVAVVKGMLSMKEEAMADTHRMRTIATSI